MGLGGELSRLELRESEEGRPVRLHWGNALQRQAGSGSAGRTMEATRFKAEGLRFSPAAAEMDQNRRARKRLWW